MLHVTWEWLGQAPALDLANTVAVVDGAEHDLIESPEDYDRWARGEAGALPDASSDVLWEGRRQLAGVRAAVRGVLAALAAGDAPPVRHVEELNRVSRRAPGWPELEAPGLALVRRSRAPSVDVIAARYARSAMEIVAGEAERVRRCPAPSCGMFYLNTRDAQLWCSVQCGTRARVARHSERRRKAAAARRTDGDS